MKRLCGLIMGLLPFCSCSIEEPEINKELHEGNETVLIRFSADVSAETRSSISPEETSIRDLNIYAFRNGVLEDQLFASSTEMLIMNLPSGSEYDIYAVANLGRYEVSCHEEDFIRDFEYSIQRISDIDGYIPMACSVNNVHVGSSNRTVLLKMERMAARLTLSVDKDALLEGLQVQSVRLCQCAARVFPFKWNGNGGSRVQTVSETIDGDYATASDIQLLNNGGEMVLYTLENCQGILLPDNNDPFKKVPMMIEGKEDLCTYIDVKCSFKGQGLFDGDVSYRIYVGLDACTSFDIPGNSCIDISLMLTGEGLKKVSWKVDADVSVRDGHVTGYVSEGMHGLDDLYVGEILKYEVEFSDELMTYLGGDLGGCSLVLYEDDYVEDGMIFSNVSWNDNVMTADIMCRKPCEGELYVYSPEGECIGCLADDVTVKVPGMIFSEYSSWKEDESVECLTFYPICEINGSSDEFYLYLVDEDGYNLNGVRSYGFDKTLFTFRDEGAVVEDERVENIRTDYIAMSAAGKGSAVAYVVVECQNAGTDHDVNLLLADIFNAGKTVNLSVAETYLGISSRVKVGLDIPQIVLRLVDNGWAGYFKCQLSMEVSNPSNLPLEISVWQLVATDIKYESVNREYVEENLLIDKVEYITGTFYNDMPPFYGSSSSFVSERNDNGDQALNKQALMIYPLEGISSDDIIMAVNYDLRGANQMVHMVDATICGQEIAVSDIMLHDDVSNGSAEYNYLYYSDESRNYRGATLFSKGRKIASSRTWIYDYPNVSAWTLDMLNERYFSSKPVHVSMIYVPDDGKVAAMTYVGNGAQYGLTLSFLYYGIVNGYVRTYPKGTWLASQDNYCSVDFTHKASGVPLRATASFIWADAGELKAAMDGIYACSYKDSPRPLGSDSYMHRAHPTDMDLEMNILVEGDKGKELYPFYVDWDSDYLEYWHEQDATKYKCNLSSECQCFSFVMVRPK